MRGTAALAAGLAALLPGCSSAPPPDQVRLCRQALPALNPDGRVKIARVARGDDADAIRIDYTLERDDRPVLERFATCRFAREARSGRAELTGLATETGPLTGASLYLLKRYYLDTPDGAAGDPGTGRSEQRSGSRHAASRAPTDSV